MRILFTFEARTLRLAPQIIFRASNNFTTFQLFNSGMRRGDYNYLTSPKRRYQPTHLRHDASSLNGRFPPDLKVQNQNVTSVSNSCTVLLEKWRSFSSYKFNFQFNFQIQFSTSTQLNTGSNFNTNFNSIQISIQISKWKCVFFYIAPAPQILYYFSSSFRLLFDFSFDFSMWSGVGRPTITYTFDMASAH